MESEEDFMNCMSKKVKRSKQTLAQKEYKEKLANLTPEERREMEEKNLAIKKRLWNMLGVMNTISTMTDGVYSDKRIWRE